MNEPTPEMEAVARGDLLMKDYDNMHAMLMADLLKSEVFTDNERLAQPNISQKGRRVKYETKRTSTKSIT